MMIPLSTSAEVKVFTVRSDLRIVAAISFWVILGLVSIHRSAAASSKVQFKVQILLFELSSVALCPFATHHPSPSGPAHRELCTRQIRS